MTGYLTQTASDMRRATRLAAVLMLAGMAAGALLALTAGSRPAEVIGLQPGAGAQATAGDILVNNARVVLSVLVAAGTAAAAHFAAQSGSSRRSRILPLAFRTACDGAVAAVVALNVTLVSIALAAFGPLVIRALWLHGPVETFGFSLALSLYLAARGGQLTWQRTAAVAPLSVAVLAVAALLETHSVF